MAGTCPSPEKWFHAVQYGVRRDTGIVDLDEVRDLARRERPKLIFCGGTAIPRTIDFPGFAEIAGEVAELATQFPAPGIPLDSL
jgi:glycine hydroxymethyltransferase